MQRAMAQQQVDYITTGADQTTNDFQSSACPPRRPGSAPGSMTLAASFFVRATEKLNRSSKTAGEQSTKVKKHKSKRIDSVPPAFLPRDRASLLSSTPMATPTRQAPAVLTKFSELLRVSAPPLPKLTDPAIPRPKVKVLLRIVDGPNATVQQAGASCLAELGSFNQPQPLVTVDPKRTYVTVHESVLGNEYVAPSQRKQVPPKVFPFDAIFTRDDPLPNLCASALTDIVEAVVNGVDGCAVSYGSTKLGKSSTMVGQDSNVGGLGMIPCAIAWLFQLINTYKEQSHARFSVRVSAVEISGRNETVRDLLSELADNTDAVSCTAPAAYLRARTGNSNANGDTSGASDVELSELRAPSAERAAFYLDKALQARTKHGNDDDATRMDHFMFTLHVYQCRVEKQEVSGGHSKLHLLDLGLGCRSRDAPSAMTSAAISNVMLGLLNGQRHIAHRESRLTQFLRDSLSLTCLCAIVAHVSTQIQHYSESMNALQFSQRLLRLQRRRSKPHSHRASSDESTSSYDSFGVRRAGRCRPRGLMMGTSGLMRPRLSSSALSQSEPDGACTSSSEQSCDTVIYLGNGSQLHVTEMTDTDTDAGRSGSSAIHRPIKRSRSASASTSASVSSGGSRSRKSASSRLSSSGIGHWFLGSAEKNAAQHVQSAASDASHYGSQLPDAAYGNDGQFYQGLEEVWIDGPREFRCANGQLEHAAQTDAETPTQTQTHTQTQVSSPANNVLLAVVPTEPAQLPFTVPLPVSVSVSVQAQSGAEDCAADVDVHQREEDMGDDRYERNSCMSSCPEDAEDVDVRGGRALSDISERTEKTQPIDGFDPSESSIPDLPVVFPEMLSNLLRSDTNSERRSDDHDDTAVLPSETAKPQELVSSWIEQHVDPNEISESSLCCKFENICQLRETAIASVLHSNLTTPFNEQELEHDRDVDFAEGRVPPTPPPLPPLLTSLGRSFTNSSAGMQVKLHNLHFGSAANDDDEDIDHRLLDLAAQPPSLSTAPASALASAFQAPGLKNLERVAQWLQTLSIASPSQGISPSNSIAQSSTRSVAAESQQAASNVHAASTPSLPTPTSDALKTAIPPANSSRPVSGLSLIQPQPASTCQQASVTLPVDTTAAASASAAAAETVHLQASLMQTSMPRSVATDIVSRGVFSSNNSNLDNSTVQAQSQTKAQSNSVQTLATTGLYTMQDCMAQGRGPFTTSQCALPLASSSHVGQHPLMVTSLHSHASLPFSYASVDPVFKPETRDADVQTQPVADVVWLSRLANPSLVSPGCVSPCYSASNTNTGNGTANGSATVSGVGKATTVKSPRSAKSLLKCMLFPRHSCAHQQKSTKTGSGSGSGSMFCVRRSESVEDTNLRYRVADAMCSDQSSSGVLSDSGSASRRSFTKPKSKSRNFFFSSFSHRPKELSNSQAQVMSMSMPQSYQSQSQSQSQPPRILIGESASDVTPSNRHPAGVPISVSTAHAHQYPSQQKQSQEQLHLRPTCSPMYQSAWQPSHPTANGPVSSSLFPQSAYGNTRITHAASHNHTLSTFALSSGHVSDSSACGIPCKSRMDAYTFLPRGIGASSKLRYRRIPYIHNAFGRSTTAGTSSGYESMMRDSEATSSSHNDSTSESSVADGVSNNQRAHRKHATTSTSTTNGITRSSSAPPQKMMGFSLGLLNASHHKSRSQRPTQMMVAGPQDVAPWNVSVANASGASAVTMSMNESSLTHSLQRRNLQLHSEVADAVRPTQLNVTSACRPLAQAVQSIDQASIAVSNNGSLLQYGADEVDRVQRRLRQQITREIEEEQRRLEIHCLLQKQSLLKSELSDAKKRLQADPACWSYDLHVAEETDPRDPGFLEALRKETEILEKRVKACKSHVMMVTSFDSTPN